MNEKIALAPCNGMSANGLICRVAVGDLKNQNDNAISICMGSTSADIENKNIEMLKKYPIIALNGCGNNCVNTILESKGINVSRTINAGDILEKHGLFAKDPYRLDDDGEECVKIIKKELEKLF
jgi:uncharacterized metal-binding protein